MSRAASDSMTEVLKKLDIGNIKLCKFTAPILISRFV